MQIIKILRDCVQCVIIERNHSSESADSMHHVYCVNRPRPEMAPRHSATSAVTLAAYIEPACLSVAIHSTSLQHITGYSWRGVSSPLFHLELEKGKKKYRYDPCPSLSFSPSPLRERRKLRPAGSGAEPQPQTHFLAYFASRKRIWTYDFCWQ